MHRSWDACLEFQQAFYTKNYITFLYTTHTYNIYEKKYRKTQISSNFQDSTTPFRGQQPLKEVLLRVSWYTTARYFFYMTYLLYLLVFLKCEFRFLSSVSISAPVTEIFYVLLRQKREKAGDAHGFNDRNGLELQFLDFMGFVAIINCT